METKSIKVFVVDDSAVFKSVLKRFLTEKLKFRVVGEASNGNEFNLMKEKVLQADVVLMDIEMPVMDGIAATKKWSFANIGPDIIAITMYSEKAYLRQLIEAGFKGCIFKNNVFDNLQNAIYAVIKGNLYFPDDVLIEHI